MDERVYIRYFKAFGEPSRIKILRLLSDKEMTVNQIVDKINLSQPTVSRHLAILRDADIVIDRRDGQNVYYSLNRKAVESCCTDFCCGLKISVKGAGKGKKK
jgi:ArsR family transcriptional regulator